MNDWDEYPCNVGDVWLDESGEGWECVDWVDPSDGRHKKRRKSKGKPPVPPLPDPGVPPRINPPVPAPPVLPPPPLPGGG